MTSSDTRKSTTTVSHNFAAPCLEGNPLDSEGTVLCEKCDYVSADGKPIFDWEDREVARRKEKEKEKEVLLVKCSCRKKKCSERSNCKCRKSSICCGSLCSCLDCGNVIVEAQGLNELRDDELSCSSDDGADESGEGQ